MNKIIFYISKKLTFKSYKIIGIIVFLFFAITPYNSHPQTIEKQKNNVLNDDFYYNKALDFYNINFDSVLFYIKKARNYSINNKRDELNVAKYNLICGVAYKNIGNPDSSIFYYKEAIKIFKSNNDYRGIAATKNNLGLMYKEIGKYKQANNEFVYAISYFEKIKDTLNIAEVSFNLGELCSTIKCYNKAYTYYIKAKNKYKDANSILGLGFVYKGLGDLKIKENKPDSALNYYFKSIKIWESVDRKKVIGEICNKISKIYISKNENKKAIKYANLAISNFKYVNYKYGYVKSSSLLASIYIKNKNYIKAKKILESIINIAKEIDAKSVISDIYINLYLIEKQQHKYDKALIYYEKYNDIKKELFNIENNKNILEIQTKYDLLSKQKQIENLRDSTKISKLLIEKNTLESQQQKNITLVLIVSIVIAILIILLIYFRYRTKKNLSQKLTVALNDREILLKELHHRVKNNLQIVSSLLNLQTGKGKDMSIDEILEISRNRISTMVMIHEKLYKSKNLKSISLKNYIFDLSNSLLKSSNNKYEEIKIHLDIQDIFLDINKLIPCGLIINELFTNSIQHAFPNISNGLIEIIGIKDAESYIITIRDNGVGLPENYQTSNSLGLKLVKGLSKQLDGEFIVKNSTDGASFSIKFKV